jgi:hypothetical protein
MTLALSEDIVIGITHLKVNGELVRLFRCPFCSFKNIHEDEITHHIKYKDDISHNVDVDKLDKSCYIVTKKESHYHYESKQDLPLPWIKCLWCDFWDKVERDIEWHFLEKHSDKKRGHNELFEDIKFSRYERRQAWKHDPFSFMYSSLDYTLEKAVKLAKKNTLALSFQKEGDH